MKVLNRKKKKEIMQQAYELSEVIQTPIIKIEIRLDGNNVFECGATSIGMLVDSLGEEETQRWLEDHIAKLHKEVDSAINDLEEIVKHRYEKNEEKVKKNED